MNSQLLSPPQWRLRQGALESWSELYIKWVIYKELGILMLSLQLLQSEHDGLSLHSCTGNKPPCLSCIILVLGGDTGVGVTTLLRKYKENIMFLVFYNYTSPELCTWMSTLVGLREWAWHVWPHWYCTVQGSTATHGGRGMKQLAVPGASKPPAVPEDCILQRGAYGKPAAKVNDTLWGSISRTICVRMFQDYDRWYSSIEQSVEINH